MLKMGDMWGQLGSVMASMMFAYAMFKQFFPDNLGDILEKYGQKLVAYVYPYIQITFDEYDSDFYRRSEVYSAIQNYLSTKSSTLAKRLKAHEVKGSKALVLGMDDNEEVTDEFEGVKLWWASKKSATKKASFSDLIIGRYIEHVMKEGNAIKLRNRERKLYTNNGVRWSHVVFEHPATFQTLAMDPVKKQEIMDDLMTFSKAEEFYKSIGRAWKRGYLLYGPPGTGKSTMIAAMANHLGYNIYDLELTSVKNNTELRKLLLETSNKSLIVIEDIDCSQVTLSGLLNFIDGLWSACKGERLIVFTTNHVEKLDAALTRKGRLDKHIELSYCTFEAFKVLARNYLKLESHHLFPTICELLGKTNVVPADVAEHLMPKTLSQSADICLQNLVQALKKEKENGKLIAEEERKYGKYGAISWKCMTSTQDHLIEDKKRAKN
ncbi:mitochondrial chaperone BCS1-B [Pyrus ussuriensis x Pyrus communis]|uniref:Mitochondrial chaperone BCS1-B n=1 Tax=Pyrus ussuriensis x Pyrus communis TaxID=2448454 RepID=A0A5N5GK34_9ROSA|nr:mitochondrial chaperone BCS1-B [Pyrus ussuriensis x Pyrus communis]